ncbi:hypothetical protein DPMN_172168 [Dreissena polymorpha]|uniref:Uncharacterized protein n=1 Tax=Dreissena polymorpha TaxID=45954 RepID=A0A9D4ID31_DREPO|nr:hypothetical protein DPMN_172168 [Dreissena polymorpha]
MTACSRPAQVRPEQELYQLSLYIGEHMDEIHFTVSEYQHFKDVTAVYEKAFVEEEGECEGEA